MRISDHIFRAYDIRGIYGKDLTEEVSERIGRAYATYLQASGKKILIGRDVRTSGEVLSRSIAKGLLKAGCKVGDLGVISTPILYISIVRQNADGGIMVTASHNPAEWNGFKLCREKAHPIAEGTGMEEIKRMTLDGTLAETSKGILEPQTGTIKDYIDFITSKVKVRASMKVAMDLGNGTATLTAPRAFQRISCSTFSINEVPDGRFPNHPPEPNEENLIATAELVRSTKADFGVGFDGDADRAIFVDDRGRILPGDTTLAILAKYYLKLNPGGKVIYDVACSSAVPKVVQEAGGTPLLNRVGRAYVMRRMITEGAILGGEVSSHLYFSDIYGLDDALFGALKIAEVISNSGRNLSDLVDELPRYPKTPVMNFDCPDEVKFRVIDELIRDLRRTTSEILTIDGVKAVYPYGWLLIRASNTLPQVKMIAEADTSHRLQELTELGRQKVREKIKLLTGG